MDILEVLLTLEISTCFKLCAILDPSENLDLHLKFSLHGLSDRRLGIASPT